MHHVAAAAAAAVVGLFEQAPLLALKHVPDAVTCEAHEVALKLTPKKHAHCYVVHDVCVLEVAYAAHEERRRHAEAVEPPDVVARIVAGHYNQGQ